MERDFLGLATTNASSVIKQEIHDAGNASEQRGSRSQWYFSDKVSTSSQVVSFKSYPEEKPNRGIFYPVPSPGLVTVSTTENSSQLQQSDPQPVFRPRGVKLYHVPNYQNQIVSPAMSYPVRQSPSPYTFPTEQHIGSSTSDLPSFGCVPETSPASRIPTMNCFPTYTDTGITSKPPNGPAQLTIFYAGSVIVYDSISPEKAQAIMLLAGNGASSTSPSLLPSTQVQASITKHPTHDAVCGGNPPHTTSTSSGLVSPVSIFSPLTSRCGGVSNPRAVASSQHQQPEPPKAVNSQRASVGSVIPGPVPQARKASLARFLEKRKERVTSSQPYSVEQKLSERNTSSASDNLNCTLRLTG
ncbi:unnamed protein product [Rhodiola kirilowii]